MISTAPAFWWKAAGWQAGLLTPLSLVYAAVARRRMLDAAREKMALPVLCVGNLTVGGSGKTPVAIALAHAAAAMGHRPGFLSRGHGGLNAGPHIVDPSRDSAALVGDEPLLLSAHAQVAVTPDRAVGARLLAARGCDFIIMDDGFQSARIHMDFALIVVDAHHGLGNGRVIPAGPLRARVSDQLRYADAIVRMGEGTAANALARDAASASKPVYDASTKIRDANRFAGRRFLAFAGIGHPQKFFASLEGAGGIVRIAKTFPDHHPYEEQEIRGLFERANGQQLAIVTTAKDVARLRGLPGISELVNMIEVLEIDVEFRPPQIVQIIIEQTVEAWRERVGAD